ncbi:MAG: sugar transferase [Dysosmobacter sp.]|nr:sugar transferase [Dysosmobacter sp.]
MYQRFFKRIFDIVLSLCALVILSPVLLAVAVLVWTKLGSPVIFHQERPGKDEKIFRLYKFRSMTDARGENGNLLPDAQRLTPFGRKLRATSLDELPELWNILKGDMSIVGPRPQLVRDMVFMTPEQRKRHTVRPGLTGLAQVSGRNGLLWEDRLSRDLEYIEQITLEQDARIILQTVKCLLYPENVATEGMATSEDLGDYLLRIGEVSNEEYAEKQRRAQEELALIR